MADPAKKLHQATVLRALADRIEEGSAELPDVLVALLSAPVGPPATAEQRSALARAKKAWLEDRESFRSLDEAQRWFEAREKR